MFDLGGAVVAGEAARGLSDAAASHDRRRTGRARYVGAHPLDRGTRGWSARVRKLRWTASPRPGSRWRATRVRDPGRYRAPADRRGDAAVGDARLEPHHDRGKRRRLRGDGEHPRARRDGEVVAESFATATCGTGCRGDFSTQIDVPIDARAARHDPGVRVQREGRLDDQRRRGSRDARARLGFDGAGTRGHVARRQRPAAAERLSRRSRERHQRLPRCGSLSVGVRDVHEHRLAGRHALERPR